MKAQILPHRAQLDAINRASQGGGIESDARQDLRGQVRLQRLLNSRISLTFANSNEASLTRVAICLKVEASDAEFKTQSSSCLRTKNDLEVAMPSH
jgi:hypothetical protein